ncbi:DUF6503 family protein [Phaeodactylibacter luteus]|jgi:hypothetical protein|uniref:Deoxyribose-phosphate aldolase n=1 Tax=Phaeodactylibacter luteus TaxID=1564516 RepID=A0A5C6RIS9_9BACT|nr:DUF6503 family protein [Phaeodactylibacter luteus]TXB62316.1 hypothetical protein FRY97_14820 [Phaeodactylibacter luteus]
MKKHFYLIGLSCLLFAGVLLTTCNTDNATDGSPGPVADPEIVSHDSTHSANIARAKTIIDQAVSKAGLSGFNSTAVSFRFRDKEYRYQRNAGKFRYERWWQDTVSGERIRDILTNTGLTRLINDEEVDLPDKKRKAYSNSVNSVIYFAFMPWALTDPAVIPVYEGRENIKGEVLDRVRVGFEEENGGSDNKDEFLYWFSPENRQLKYLAYSHPGGAMPRFRVAYNERTVDGFTVRDYHNFTTADKSARTIDKLSQDYQEGKLVLLSEINLEGVQIVPTEE